MELESPKSPVELNVWNKMKHISRPAMPHSFHKYAVLRGQDWKDAVAFDNDICFGQNAGLTRSDRIRSDRDEK